MVRPVLKHLGCRPPGKPNLSASRCSSSSTNPCGLGGATARTNAKSQQNKKKREKHKYCKDLHKKYERYKPTKEQQPIVEPEEMDINRVKLKANRISRNTYKDILSSKPRLAETAMMAKYLSANVKKKMKNRIQSWKLSRALNFIILKNESRTSIWDAGDEPTCSRLSVCLTPSHSQARSINFSGVLTSGSFYRLFRSY